MKLTYYVMAAMMCLNGFVLIASSWGITPIPLTSFNSTKFEEGYNASQIVSSWDWSEKDFYDVGAGIGFLWNQNVPIVESAIGFFQNIGTPSQVLNPIRAIWRFFWVGFIICFLSGRDFMP